MPTDTSINVAELKPTAVAVVTETKIEVVTTWNHPGLDRHDGLSWGLADRAWKQYSNQLWARRARDARRLAKAVNDGVVFTGMSVKLDIFGKSYVAATSRVYGRHLNADLSRLGY